MIKDGTCLQYKLSEITDETINELIDRGKIFTLVDSDIEAEDLENGNDDSIY